METVYAWCAIIAGTLLVGQFLLNLVGLAQDGDLDLYSDGADEIGLPSDGGDAAHAHDGFDHSGEWFVGMLSFRALVAGATIFGLAGLTARHHFPPSQTFLIALASCAAMLYLVAWLMRTINRLRSDGTVRLERAIGHIGAVYLSVPAGNSGSGKVTLEIQGRTMEFTAVTPGETLLTGTSVVVRGVVAPGVIEVAKADAHIPAPIEESHV